MGAQNGHWRHLEHDAGHDVAHYLCNVSITRHIIMITVDPPSFRRPEPAPTLNSRAPYHHHPSATSERGRRPRGDLANATSLFLRANRDVESGEHEKCMYIILLIELPFGFPELQDRLSSLFGLSLGFPSQARCPRHIRRKCARVNGWMLWLSTPKRCGRSTVLWFTIGSARGVGKTRI